MTTGDACGAPVPGVQDDLGWTLSTLLRAYVRRADEALVDLPGTARGYRLLASVARDCPRSQLALAQHIGLDRTVVTYLIDDLAAAGLLKRQADPEDRRARRIVVTAAGRRRLRSLDAALARVELELLSGLADDEQAHLRTLLSRAAGHLVAVRGGVALPVEDTPCPGTDLADAVAPAGRAAGLSGR